MILHLIPDEKFTPEVVEFFNEYYSDHFFIIYYKNKLDYCTNLSTTNTIFLDLAEVGFGHFKKMYKQATTVFFHSIIYTDIYKYFFIRRNTLKKSVFIVWGGDIYNDHIEKQKSNNVYKSLKRFVRLSIKYLMIHQINTFMTFAAGDFELCKKWYRVKGKSFDCLYPSTINKDELDSCNIGKPNNCYNVLVGNSATQTNNHEEAFAILSKFKDENIRVLCPLSYGDTNYSNEVQKKGYELFGDKFIPLTNYMSPSKYAEVLSTIHVALFNHNRQQATGNIEILSYYGAKLFMRTNITTWNHYVERDGCSFFNIDSINNMAFDAFIRMDDKDKKHNKDYFINIWDRKYIKSLWDKVLINQ